jgi:hypothetical protein
MVSAAGAAFASPELLEPPHAATPSTIAVIASAMAATSGTRHGLSDFFIR